MPGNEENAPRVNHEITSPNVLLVDENGVKVGVTNTNEAIHMALEQSLIMDYGKYRYQVQKKEKDARKKQKVQELKEIKMRPKIDDHDFDFKTKAVRQFLEKGHRVKVSVFFRGREMSFQERGEDVLNRVIAECEDVGKCEAKPIMEGRYMRILLTPQTGSTSSPAQAPKQAVKQEAKTKGEE